MDLQADEEMIPGNEEEVDYLLNMDLDLDIREMMMFSTLQLLDYENFSVSVDPCSCHAQSIKNFGMSFHTNADSEIYPLLCSALELDFSVAGTYFVVNSVGSMFTSFAPTFFEKKVESARGMLINVTPDKQNNFLKCIAQIGDLGLVPCDYLREIDVDTDSEIVRMLVKEWFEVAAVIIVHWQESKVASLIN
ncbi:hypothetical protein ORF22 [Crane-associated adenovirus 1]|uniref:Uncharacterized protein n=1 Tax=Crane-associated adenovirus 1 TaxID=2559941 RepID=A0A5H2X3C9_9ADEN|nr:hypothetical protein ORF22 [Crane-associated adenovirus 1]